MMGQMLQRSVDCFPSTTHVPWIYRRQNKTPQIFVFWFEPQLGYRPSWLRTYRFFLILSIEACAPRLFDRNDNSYRSSLLGTDEIGDHTGRCALTLSFIHFLQCYLEPTGSENNFINTEPKEINKNEKVWVRFILNCIDFINRAGPSGVRIAVGARDFSVFLYIQTGSGAHSASYSRGVKRTGPEVNFSLPCSAAVKNEWSYFSTPFICVKGVGREHISL